MEQRIKNLSLDEFKELGPEKAAEYMAQRFNYSPDKLRRLKSIFVATWVWSAQKTVDTVRVE